MSQTPFSTPSQPSPAQVEARALQRVRHELRLRTLTVQRAERITPHCVRVTLEGGELAGFHSPGFDDHVKLFLPDPSTGEPVLPAFDAQGAPVPGAPRPAMRDYTPRLHDAQAGTLAIDFALHDAGPATAWALQAAPGQRISIGGRAGRCSCRSRSMDTCSSATTRPCPPSPAAWPNCLQARLPSRSSK